MREALAAGVAAAYYTKDEANKIIEGIKRGSKGKIDIGERF